MKIRTVWVIVKNSIQHSTWFDVLDAVRIRDILRTRGDKAIIVCVRNR
jgi:hypothetical protein